MVAYLLKLVTTNARRVHFVAVAIAAVDLGRPCMVSKARQIWRWFAMACLYIVIWGFLGGLPSKC